MSRRMPRGVRKVNENIIQDGRSLIINEENEKNISWENIPDGSIKINSSNGMMYVKIKGESDWVPAGIKNDGTLSIAKDTFIIEEIFTIKTLSDGNGEFSYYNTEGEVRHGELLEDGSYVFTLEKGSYPMLRNHLEIIIDDALRRTAISGGIIRIEDVRADDEDCLAIKEGGPLFGGGGVTEGLGGFPHFADGVRGKGNVRPPAEDH